MKDTIRLIESLNEEDELYEMANPHPDDTGLPSMLNALYNGKNRVSHAARVKVDTPNFGMIPIQLEPDVKLPNSVKNNDYKKEDLKCINAAIKYIKQNKDLFLKHWNGEITDKQLLNELPHI